MNLLSTLYRGHSAYCLGVGMGVSLGSTLMEVALVAAHSIVSGDGV